MNLFKYISLSLILSPLIINFLMLPFSFAQDSIKDFVDAHNAARAQVGVGPVHWNKTVADYAHQYANKRINDCNLVHSKGPYGENIAWGSSNLAGTVAVRMWVSEKQFYNYDTNSCVRGKMCGHYTQVVWRNSVRIGCAKVRCKSGGTFIICNYDPRGNIRGQRPYGEGTLQL
ncbi:hypothetical protein IC582_000157 [Cucumis melo]|uniref:SCP domain-containing protein n=2 Tax=Cucumis melo TaxID=3656 RepID=A0A9I9DH35_CUCME